MRGTLLWGLGAATIVGLAITVFLCLPPTQARRIEIVLQQERDLQESLHATSTFERITRNEVERNQPAGGRTAGRRALRRARTCRAAADRLHGLALLDLRCR